MLKNNRTGIIYKATCLVTNYGYFGQTTKPLAIRKHEHLQKALGGSNTPFHRAIREHGEDAFIWEVLADEIPEDKLGQVERSYIATFDTVTYGYNANSGGGGKKATPQLQPSLRWVSENELTLHWGLNRRRNDKHVYALAQRMQTFGGFDSAYPIGTIEIDGELHVYSGHHRAAAAFSRDMSCQLYPLLPLEKVPVTVIQGDMDTLIEKMWTAHDDNHLKLHSSERMLRGKILMSFPHIYRLSSRKISKMWNISFSEVEDLRRETSESLRELINTYPFDDYLPFEGRRTEWFSLEDPYYPGTKKDSEFWENNEGAPVFSEERYTLKRFVAMERLVKVMEAETILQSALPSPPEIPEQQIRWLDECLTLALPESNDRLAALQILLKRLCEDL